MSDPTKAAAFFVRPSKPVSEMTEVERREFSRYLARVTKTFVAGRKAAGVPSASYGQDDEGPAE